MGQSVVVQGCGVQLGRFHGEVPTAIGGPSAGVWRSRADGGPPEVRHTSRASSQGICATAQGEEHGYSASDTRGRNPYKNKGPEAQVARSENCLLPRSSRGAVNQSPQLPAKHLGIHSLQVLRPVLTQRQANKHPGPQPKP